MAKKRKNGTGTVRHRKDGRWEGRVVVDYDAKGLPITKNVTAKTKMQCLEKLKKLKESLGGNSNKLSNEMSFGEWMDYWYQTYVKETLRASTQMEYECRIYRHIIPSLGNVPLNALKQNDLQQFYANLKSNGRILRRETEGEGLSDRTVRACHTSCRTALQKAVEENLIRINPAIGCKLPPKKSKEMQVLTTEEMQRFLIQAKAEGYYELFLLELATGMRRGEILALQWEDINFRTGELHIQRQVNAVNGHLTINAPKTKSSVRTLILPPSILKVLSNLKSNSASRWLFPSSVKSDTPLYPSAVRRRLKLILERAECKNIRFHDLRHTFATIALEHGMDVKTLSTIIGHISAATTLDVYSHVTETMQQKAAKNIDRGICHKNTDLMDNQEKIKQTPDQSDFKPNFGKIRKSGTGCITKKNDHLYEGRYSPTNAYGKRISKNVYAKTREDCETKLAELIKEMKSEIEAEKKSLQEQKCSR